MTWPRKYDKISAEQLSAWLQAGLNLQEMAAQIGTDPHVIRRAFQYQGVQYIPHRHRKSKTARIDPAAVRRLYWEEMWSQQQIAARFGVCDTTIRVQMAREGIPTRQQSGHSRGEVCSWHSREWLAEQMLTSTYQDIAEQCDCHPQTIIKAAKRFGLMGRNHPRKTARRQAHEVIREAVQRVAARQPVQVEEMAVAQQRRPPADWPECPEWLWDMMA